MTNQQGAPEALRTVTRYEVVDCIDSKHVPAVIPNKDGPWVRYEDHLAAMVEAQQPAPSAAAANTKTAELLSTTVGLLMGYREGGARQPYKQGSVVAKVIDEVVDHLKDWPSPTPQAASSAVLKAIRAANMQLVRTGDDEFMLVTYKNAKAQCDGGKCGIGGYCDDCPAPQADSQPAHQQEAWEPLTDSQIMASIGRNAGKPNTLISESRPLGKQWGQVCNLVRDIFRERYATAPAAVAGWKLVPVEPTQTMLDAMQSSGWMPGNYKAMLAVAPTPPTQAADSVQDLRLVHDAVTIDLLNERAAYLERKLKEADSVLEDAARYRYLRDGDWREHEELESVVRLQLNTLWDAKIDAARAAQEGK